MKIRVAEIEDVASLVEIYRPYVEKTAITFEYEVPTVEEYTQRMTQTLKKYPYLVLENEQEKIVGYAYAGTYKGRTDTIIVMTINPQTKKTMLMSIPRDMKVNLPDYEDESPAKINAAYAYGGTKETINTVQKYFNIPIDYYALVNMAGMKQAINQVGGVTVTSPLTFTYEGYSFTKGVPEHMNGTKALKFCRMRYDDPQGDYGRQQRQKMVIMALLKKSASYKTVLNQKFLKTISKNAKTDLSFSNMMTLAKSYRGATKNIQQGHVQGTDDDSDGQAFQSVSYNERQRVSNILRKNLGLDPVDIDEGE